MTKAIRKNKKNRSVKTTFVTKCSWMGAGRKINYPEFRPGRRVLSSGSGSSSKSSTKSMDKNVPVVKKN